MTNRNFSNINVPEARDAMDKFKMEAASEVGAQNNKQRKTNLRLHLLHAWGSTRFRLHARPHVRTQ